MSVTTGGGATRTRFDVPIGTILEFGHANDPGASVGDYLECNGQNVSRVVYADLFNKYGTVWGVGDGVTTFGLPDKRRRVSVGKGGVGTATLANTVGSTGGAETETPTLAKTAAHVHSSSSIFHGTDGTGTAGTVRAPGNALNTTVGAVNNDDTDGPVTTAVFTNGSGTALNIVQSAIVCGFWVKT